MQVEQMQGIHRDDSNGSLTLHCTIDGQEMSLGFDGRASTKLLAALMSMPEPEAGEEIVQAPMEPSGLSTFRLSNGQKGISVHFPNGYVIQLAIPPGAAHHLRKLADQLEQMS